MRTNYEKALDELCIYGVTIPMDDDDPRDVLTIAREQWAKLDEGGRNTIRESYRPALESVAIYIRRDM